MIESFNVVPASVWKANDKFKGMFKPASFGFTSEPPAK